MMKPSSPIDSDVTFPTVEPCSTFHRTSGADATELEQTIENRAIISNIKSALFLLVLIHVVWCDLIQEIYVFVCMELCHFELGCGFCTLWGESAYNDSSVFEISR